ncbi:ion transporter [Crocinitomix algicola]|uniref:ion transporter n=1 Tax=Crocinitomix algicola TaxID=1740263 RepID=UPI000834E809|nr:ion transporter [Crocinitomix algicola]
MPKEKNIRELTPWQKRLHEIIFEADTPSGKAFDIVLLIAIILSVLVVMIESVPEYGEAYKTTFLVIEWSFTILFTIEYALRIMTIRRPFTYILSFYGIVDLLSIIPTYLGLFISGTHTLMVIRTLRLLRVFRILKLGKYLRDAQTLALAIKNSKSKIIVFLGSVMAIVIILGTVMYLIESPESGFTSIPRSIYWAIVTLTTVGYGDIYPSSDLGQFIAAIVMILGYGIIAVPTGIVTNELIVSGTTDRKHKSTQVCQSCAKEGHDPDAIFCKYCGEKLNP